MWLGLCWGMAGELSVGLEDTGLGKWQIFCSELLETSSFVPRLMQQLSVFSAQINPKMFSINKILNFCQ